MGWGEVGCVTASLEAALAIDLLMSCVAAPVAAPSKRH